MVTAISPTHRPKTRRRMPTTTLVTAALTLLILSEGWGSEEAFASNERSRPNVLIILTDDQPSYNATWKVMPETRRLFRKGGTFYPNAVATTPRCCPSRASILTGRYAHNHRVRHNGQSEKLKTRTTIPNQLQRTNYLTATAGKFLQSWGERRPPGFDRWATFVGSRRYFGIEANIDGRIRRVRRYSTGFVRHRAVRFLKWFDRRDGRPWFMYLAPNAPHLNAFPHPKYRQAPVPGWRDTPATNERSLRDKPPYVRRNGRRSNRGNISSSRKAQLRTLMSVDDMVSAVFRKINHLNERNTLAIYLSDNGYLWYDHRLKGKLYPYDRSVQIPLAARWPGQIRRGETSHRIVANIDIAPTLYAVARVRPTYRLDGWSLLGPHIRKYILLENWRDQGVPTWKSIWTPRRQYIEFKHQQREYYAASDPWQLVNRFSRLGKVPARAVRFAKRLRMERSCIGGQCP